MDNSFKPKQVVKKLLATLPERARDVLEKRYGLTASGATETLESIGQVYGITRERVRQIENYGIQAIRKSEAYTAYAPLFTELEAAIERFGGIVAEHELLSELATDATLANYYYFLLVIGAPFSRTKENARFHHRWYVRKELAESIEQAIEGVYESFSDETLIGEDEITALFLEKLSTLDEQYRDAAYVKRWLALSKAIAQNPLGEWGLATSPNVRAKGIRDFAYLAVKRHGSPMHFREVAEAIQELFNRTAHVATCHNELIKDARFVLVGRGLYALTEWGYSAGVVKDVLREILRQNGPLSRDEIVERVRKERYVKDNTIVVNLQDPAFFRRLPNGLYALAE